MCCKLKIERNFILRRKPVIMIYYFTVTEQWLQILKNRKFKYIFPTSEL